MQVKPKGLDGDSWVDDKRRTPFAGLQVILYLRAGTDSAQPIRVVRDSYVKGYTNKILAHLLRNLNVQ